MLGTVGGISISSCHWARIRLVSSATLSSSSSSEELGTNILGFCLEDASSVQYSQN